MPATSKAPLKAPLAYSYMRFSSVGQSQGDSIRRQTRAAKEWCEKNGVRLDESLTFRDLGKSAFLGEHRKNPDRHALAAFLKLVQDGRVPRESYLVIESLDRLTREHVRAGLMLLLGLIESGIRIVQLSPSELVYDEKSDEMGLMLAIVELSRGHRESKRKSDLITSVWNRRKQQARESKQPYIGHLPAWVESRDGKLRLIPERAAVVKRIFRLATGGYGLTSIVKKLTKEKVPAFGEVLVREGRKRSQFSGRWSRAYIAKIIRDRRAMGEFQPCRREGQKKVPDGDPIPGYFPAVVTEQVWLAARAAAAERGKAPGRIGKNSNVFAGLVRHARDGDTYFQTTKYDCHRGRVNRSAPQRILINTWAAEGSAPCCSFPFDVFERAILSCLQEIDPHEILNGDHGPDEALALAGHLAEVESSIALISREMDEHGESPTLFKRLRAKEQLQRDLAARLAEARQKAAHPLSESWGEFQTLAGALEAAPDPDDVRLRLRAVLRRMIDSIWILIVPRGHVRLCTAQIWFAEGRKHRDYLIMYRRPTVTRSFRRDLAWHVRSLADLAPTREDLRDPARAAALERVLLALDVEQLWEQMAPGV
jgi:DNA invertase Pin-like site-specific DNA recombinase